MSRSNNETIEPVTVIVKHCVKSGNEAAYEVWAQKVSHAASRFEGFLGVNFIRPSEGKGSEYVLIFKFNSYENLLVWEESDERQHWVNMRRSMTVGEPRIKRYTGWDYWFALPDAAIIPPPKYKMAIITFISLYPLALLVPMALNPFIGQLETFLFTLFNSAIIILIMSYIMMPLMVNLFKHWLYKTNCGKCQGSECNEQKS